MAIAHDLDTTSAALTSSATFTHNAIGTARGVLILISQALSDVAQVVDGDVSYGGVNVPLIPGGSSVRSVGEVMRVDAFFLGSGIPTGSQTVSITFSNDVNANLRAACYTVTAAADTEVVDFDTVSASTADPSVTLNNPAARECYVAAVLCSGHGDVTGHTAGSAYTTDATADPGLATLRYEHITTPSTATSIVADYVQTAEDACMIAVAIAEVASGDTYTLDADSATYTYTASAAGLEYDRQIVAESASYVWSASDASLEYTPAGSTYTLNADSAAYVWSATDAGLLYSQIVNADSASYVWSATDATLTYTPDADGPIAPPTIPAETAYAINFDTGRAYYSKASGVSGERVPASMTKLMTAVVLLDYKDEAGLLETTTIVADDLVGGSGANLDAGDIVTLHDLLRDAMIPSSNDATMAIAAYIGREILGNPGATHAAAVAAFVAAMNARAATLGMTNTTFVNPSGLTTSNQTTAEDISRLLTEIIENPIMQEIWRWVDYTITVDRLGTPTEIDLENDNEVFGDVGFVGGKGGSLAGLFNVAFGWEAPNGQLLIIVVMDADTTEDRYTSVRAIIDQLPIDFPELAECANPWTPDYMRTLLGCTVCHLDASDISTQYQTDDTSTPVTAATQAVGRIQSKSTTGIAATQSTANARATLQNTGDEWWWQYDGSNDFHTLGLSVGDTGLFAEAAQQFVVGARVRTADTSGTVIGRAGATAGSRTFQIAFGAAGSQPECRMRGGADAETSGLNDDEWQGLAAFWDGSKGGHSRGILGTNDIAVGTAAEETTQNIIIGARTNGTAIFLDGDISEIIITDAYDADQFRRLRDYLNGGVVNAFRDPTGGADTTVTTPTLTYGAAPRRRVSDYEAKVRAYYDQQEELERRREVEERKERERDERIKEAQRQLAELEKRKKLDSKKSAVAKRKAKLAREIEDLERQQDQARELIAQLIEQINASILEQEMLADRRRRMVLLLSLA